MKTVVAETVLFGAEAFSTLGEVLTLPDREINSFHLRDANALIVRSKTKVTAELLENTPVRFVGTATAGFDHFDTAWLERHEIGWCAAPGCNANSVSEYVMAALLELHHRTGLRLEGATLGIVGAGQVGSRVAAKAEALGMRVLLNDPPLAEQQAREPDFRCLLDPARYGGFQPLETVLQESDIVTLHVPLTDEKPWPTRRLADHRFFAVLKPGAVFINAARGKVLAPEALCCALDCGTVSHAVLDVWPQEPAFDPALLERVTLGTPHIAGYSFEGSLNGTTACYRAAARFFEQTLCWDPDEFKQPVPPIPLDPRGRESGEILHQAVAQAYSIADDDQALRETARLPDDERGAAFDRLRKTYYRRPEFFNFRIEPQFPLAPETAARLASLGFQL